MALAIGMALEKAARDVIVVLFERNKANFSANGVLSSRSLTCAYLSCRPPSTDFVQP